MKKRVLITRKIPSIGIEFLKKQGLDLIINENDRPLTESELYHLSRNADAIICMLSDNISSHFLEDHKHLKVISNYAVGFNNIDVKTASELKIRIGNTPDVLTDSTAELALGLILAATRNFRKSQYGLYNGKWKDWNPTLNLGIELKNKTVGIIGLGRIGTRLATILKNAFNMNVLYYSKSNKESKDFKKVSLEELLRSSDIISLHLSLNNETNHFISKKELSLMKPTAILINTGRGELINQDDLISALENKTIFGAALDVMTPEPIPPHSHLLKLDNVFLLPHIGSATFEARNEMSKIAALNIINGLQDKDLIGFVNKESFI